MPIHRGHRWFVLAVLLIRVPAFGSEVEIVSVEGPPLGANSERLPIGLPGQFHSDWA